MTPHVTAGGARQWTLEHLQRPMTMNEYRTLHYRRRADYDQEVRTTFGWLAKAAKIGKLKAIIVTAVPMVRAGTTMPDPGACFPAVKAAIDGIVDARIIPNDTGAYVKAITFVAPEYATRDALLLLVEEAT